MDKNDKNHDQERKSFNPLFLVKMSAVVKHAIPDQALEEMGLDPKRIRTDKRGYTRIPCRLSEGGRVLKPTGLRQNYFQLGAEELKEENLVQVVAGQDGERLQGRLTERRLFFSINQSRAVHLIRVHEGKKDLIYIFRYRLTLNEARDQNYLKCECIFPAEKDDRMENNDFTFFHYTTPSKLQEDVAEHLSKDTKFLAEAVVVALEGAHADDYPDYAKFPESKEKPKKVTKEKDLEKEEKEKETEKTTPPLEIIKEEVPKEEKKKPRPEKKPKPKKLKTTKEIAGNRRKKKNKEKDQEEADELDVKEIDKPDITESTPSKIVDDSPGSNPLTANLLQQPLKKIVHS